MTKRRILEVPTRHRPWGLFTPVTVLLLAGSLGQIAAIAIGASVGLVVCRAGTATTSSTLRFPASRTAGWICLTLFAVLLITTPLLATSAGAGALSLFATFYGAGALVFGGGHVVLPLLSAGVVETGWISSSQFLEGYGAAQAVPGPLFTFAAYLGTIASEGPGGIAGAAIALAGIFLPGFLLLTGVLPFWNALRTRPWLGPLREAPTPRLSESWPLPSTIRCSRPRSPDRRSSASGYSASSC